jgi:rare lipoprotein A
MLTSKESAPGNLTRSRTALAVFAATLFVGGTAAEASAKTRHHHHHAFHHHHHHPARYAGNGSNQASGWTPASSWREANAAMTPVSGSGHSFSGMASYYGTESSGQRFDQNALTCAHRSLPFGTRLRVTHGGRSVVVTVNDRGPFIRGRVLDLSTAAARAVGITGVGQVTAEVI